MGDWDYGRENGLWGDDGIPYGLESSNRKPYITGEEVTNEDAILLANELITIKIKIKELQDRERFLKKSIKHYIPLYSYITVQGVGIVKCKKNQKSQSAIYVNIM